MALLGRLNDDVAALEMNDPAAPGGVHGKLRAFVDVHQRTIGKLQDGSGAGTGADDFILADRGAGLQNALRNAVQIPADAIPP